MTIETLRELLNDPVYQDKSVREFMELLNGAEKAIAKDFIDEKIADLPKDDNPIGANPMMAG